MRAHQGFHSRLGTPFPYSTRGELVNRARYAFLVLRALFEMARYDVIVSSLGIGRILRQLRRQHVPVTPCSENLQKGICDAVLLAGCFYWKPVLCLQRSVCT